MTPETARNLLEKVQAEEARRSLHAFVRIAWPVVEPATTFQDNWHIAAICEHLEAVTRGEIRNLLINMPPRAMKSTIVSVMWPCWEWATTPGFKWLFSSYALQLAIRDSVKCRRLIESPWYQRHFGDVFQLASDQNLKCLLGSTRIQTDHGELTIQDIVEQKAPVRVLSFNHENCTIENKHILAYEKHPGGQCVQVLCANGASIICTGNHPFYVLGKGYIDARHLQIGDTVYERKANMRGVQERILSPLSESEGRAVSRPLLQQGMPEGLGAGRNSCAADLHTVRDFYSCRQGSSKNETQKILQQRLSRSVDSSEYRQQDIPCLSGVREAILGVPGVSTDEILLFCLLSCASSLENTRDGTSALWQRLWNHVDQGSQSGWQPMHALPGEYTSGSSSHRPRQTEQFRDQLNYAVSTLSSERDALQGQGEVATTTIVAITPSASPAFVYNLEIEDNHNYFANGILTHNSRFENTQMGYRYATSVNSGVTGEGGDACVVDDPHNVREAESAAVRETTLEWWDQAMSTRLNNPKTGRKVIVMQRVHADDLSGHVLAQGGYEHLNLPMEYEPDRRCMTSLGWVDPRATEGDLLWPERFGLEEVGKLKHILGPFGYAGQCQQRPTPKAGGTFKREWLNHRYRLLPVMTRILQTVDSAFKEGVASDYSVIATWGTDGIAYYLIHIWRGRVAFPELISAITDQYTRFTPREILIEDKASGQSAIQVLRRTTRLPIIPGSVDTSKESRADGVSPLFEAGKVLLPETAEWLDAWIDEHINFPRAAHDDQVDTTSMALARLAGNTLSAASLLDHLTARHEDRGRYLDDYPETIQRRD